MFEAKESPATGGGPVNGADASGRLNVDYSTAVPAGVTPYARHVPEEWELPQQLTELPIWFAWRLVPGDKKPGKVPVSAVDGSQNWRNLNKATTAARAIQYANDHPHLHGVGIVVSPEHGLIGGDPDQCRRETGEPNDVARSIIEEADTYTEVSPGLEGFRFIAKGTFGGYTGNNQSAHVEFYEDARFLTITGFHVEGTPWAIEERDLTELARRFHRARKEDRPAGDTPEPEIADAAEFNIPPHVFRWITEGVPPGEDRSTHLFGAAKDLIRAGATDGQALYILTDPENPISEAAYERRGSERSAREWVWRYNVATARREVDAEPKLEAIAPGVSQTAQHLAKRITDDLCAALGIDPDEGSQEIEALAVSPEAIDRMLNRSFWSGNKSKLFILNDSNSVNQYKEPDAWPYLSRACGAVANSEAITTRALAIQPPTTTPDKAQKEASRIAGIPRNAVMHELKWRNQRDHIQWRVDMFRGQPHLELKEDAARITLPHVPLPDYGEPDPELIADYRQHFPELDEVLGMIVAARFAGDRKKAYLWLLASSDWGKGFFTACLHELGLVVEMSVKEIERVFEGQPAGKRPEEFKRAWVLAINEFKSVKAEIKQLESTMQIAPKNLLTSEVELFAKLFMSAENVASLMTDHGVEDQFAQRFSLIEKRGAIDTREPFHRDSGNYRRAVVAYLARNINRLVSEYRALGRDEADRAATDVLRVFHQQHGLGNFATRFSESMGEVAEEFRDWLYTEANISRNQTRSRSTQRLYLRNATRELEDFLHARKPSDQVATIKRRKDDIFRHLSTDDRGYASQRDGGDQFKAVRLE